MIKVLPLEKAHPGVNFKTQEHRVAALAYSGRDYFQSTLILWDHGVASLGPAVNVILPMMHQTLELLVKAMALKTDPGFEPRQYSHRTIAILNAYRTAPFASRILGDSEAVLLIEQLQLSYLGVRYAEAYTSIEGTKLPQVFTGVADGLIDELHVATHLRFFKRHYPSAEE